MWHRAENGEALFETEPPCFLLKMSEVPRGTLGLITDHEKLDGIPTTRHPRQHRCREPVTNESPLVEDAERPVVDLRGRKILTKWTVARHE
jgi:hypothetical protein